MTVTVNSAANPARRYSVTPRTPPPDGGNGDQAQLLDHYLACWNETGADARRALIGRYWSADSSYVDPLTQIQGRDALAATIAAVQSQFAGFVFSPAGPLDTHHNVPRFTWGLGPEGLGVDDHRRLQSACRAGAAERSRRRSGTDLIRRW